MSEQPEQAAVPAVPVQQLSIGLAETPQGQRLAVTMTILLDADGARQFAAAITDTAAKLSSSGLIVASGSLSGSQM